MSWYYAVNGERQGPVSESDFATLLSNGTVTDQTLVWREGMPNWQAYGTVKPVASTPGDPAAPIPEGEETAVCAASGRIYPKREMIQFEGKWISAEHRDAYFQRMRQGVTQPGTMRFAGFWIRVVAQIIDGILLTILSFIFLIPFFVVSVGGANSGEMNPLGILLYLGGILMSFVARFGYEWFMLSKYQATLGKLAVGLRVVRADGSKISTGRIIGRSFAHILSGIVFYIGYIIAAFDQEKRALHDHICDTRVVYK